VIYGGSLPDGIGIRAAVPPNMTMVTGEQAGPGGEVVNILAQIDETSLNGQPFQVEIPGMVRSLSRSEESRACRKRQTLVGCCDGWWNEV
jgi:hypothetical protein